MPHENAPSTRNASRICALNSPQPSLPHELTPTDTNKEGEDGRKKRKTRKILSRYFCALCAFSRLILRQECAVQNLTECLSAWTIAKRFGLR